ncbi:uncharacterized protein LOC110701708 [Chenopodium quinoa]|uniref:uncharacterized protein LOC110701708 n=1 Tax=Chenopodium quinoa TaxID=63459 RepID=UPI000B76F6AD|nr:uncharacterized protein LOC110701708 [Chenopodium quinoa]
MAEEISNALFQMHHNKAPGTDGMHALFFQKFWHIIGPDIITYVQNWWNGIWDLKEINRTCVVLIPKCNDPKYMKDFRPISCCNVLYKIISKTLANRLKPFLDDIISVNQSAFIPGRLITDNAMVAFEIFHAMKRGGDGRSGLIALKLDMSKAYDRVEWGFLEMVNNEICGSIIPSRGLRQGDPISPYLFLLCADTFSGLLSKAANDKLIQGAKICKSAPRISHLFFADDNILFAKATPNECSKIAEIISVYERASGQKVNLDKTEIAFIRGVPPERRATIVSTLGAGRYGGCNQIRILCCTRYYRLAISKTRVYLKANRRHDPSYIWRSIWGAKGLFRDGLAWKIGNGRDINIWTDIWLVNNRQPIHLQRPPEFDEEMKVRELLTEDGRMWDEMKVRQVLGEELCSQVLSLPLPIHATRDTTFWMQSKNGVFSVKSCYYLARKGAIEAIDTNSLHKLWCLIWNYKGPPKLKHFLWNAAKGNLAVKSRLMQRHIVGDSKCLICENEDETIIHALFECTMAKEIWLHSQYRGVVDEAPAESFACRWVWLDQKVQGDGIYQIAALIWAAWRCRNLLLFEGVRSSPTVLAGNLCKWVADYGSAGKAAVGVVGRNEEGTIVLTATQSIFQQSPEISEAVVVRYGMIIARRFGFENIWIESDSLNGLYRGSFRAHTL